MRLPDGFMRLNMQQQATLRGLSRIKGVDYEELYVLGTLQGYYITCYNDESRLHLLDVWPPSSVV